MIKENATTLVNTLLTLASPIDVPVINLDVYFEAFYKKINTFLSDHRSIDHRKQITNDTNSCCNNHGKSANEYIKEEEVPAIKTHHPIEDKLLITIGGGSNDVLVPAGHTSSQYSDIHVMVWNLKLIMVFF